MLDIDLGFAIGVDWAYTSLSVNRLWDVMKNWVLVALPLFIFMGLMLERSGIANDLMTNLTRVFGRVRGGLAISVTIIGLLLAATTGIIGASVVLLALLGLAGDAEKRLPPGVGDGNGVCGRYPGYS